MDHKSEQTIRKTIAKQMGGRNALFLLYLGLSILLFYGPLRLLVKSSLENELYSHIVLIPFVSAYLAFTERGRIFRESAASALPTGSILILGGIACYFIGREFGPGLETNDFLSVMTFAAVLCWIGGFVLFYGLESFRVALFPVLFLFFMVPVPGFLMEKIIVVLQVCSTEISYGIFKLTGVPIFREGFAFHLPGLSVEVAKQCGGIRSSLVLLIVGILAGKLFLASWRKRILLVLFVFPITIVKNSIRIVTLTLLGAYVDPRILDSTLHKRGGIPFFLVSLTLLGVVLWFLRRSERRGRAGLPTVKGATEMAEQPR